MNKILFHCLTITGETAESTERYYYETLEETLSHWSEYHASDETIASAYITRYRDYNGVALMDMNFNSKAVKEFERPFILLKKPCK